jgi:DNA-binding MarR family transcriptional regulator
VNNNKQREEALTLELLQTIEQRSDVTQRHLARGMGVALGLANSYLKRCARKGLIKMQQAPTNRYLYYLTPKGFAEKSRLTAEYLSLSFSFYRQASASCARSLTECRARGAVKVGLYGVSDLAEIAALRALDQGIEIACVCDPVAERGRFLGVPVVATVEAGDGVDVWLLTDLRDPRASFDALCSKVGSEAVVAPSILGLGERPARG